MGKIVTAACAAAALVVCAGLSACSDKVETPSMSAIQLQKELTDRIVQGRILPKSVTCAGELPGEIGKTTTCEVVMTDTDAMQATVTVTSADGGTIGYDLAPSITKDQLEKAYAASESAQAVRCESGLDGRVGASTTCQVTKDGATRKTTVSVSKVSGMQIDFATG